MNTIVKAIFNEFAAALAEKYSIEATPAEMYAIWKQTIKSMTVTTSFAKPEAETDTDDEVAKPKTKKPKAKKPTEKPTEMVAPEEHTANNALCPFAAARGANMGKKCGKPCAKDSHMCSTHKKYADKYVPQSESESEPVAEQPKAVAEQPKAAPKSDSKGCDYVFSRGANKDKRCGAAQVKDTCFCSKHQKEAEKPAKKDVLPKAKPVAEEKVIFANDGTHFVMRGARPLVCKSASEKIMIGKKIDGEVVPLDEEDIAFCKKMNLKCEETPSKKALEDLLDEVQGIEAEDDIEDEVEEEEEELLEEDD